MDGRDDAPTQEVPSNELNLNPSPRPRPSHSPSPDPNINPNPNPNPKPNPIQVPGDELDRALHFPRLGLSGFSLGSNLGIGLGLGSPRLRVRLRARDGVTVRFRVRAWVRLRVNTCYTLPGVSPERRARRGLPAGSSTP